MAQTKKTAEKATKPSDDASSEGRTIASRLVGAQKRVIDFQQSSFERGFGFAASLQERQEEAVTSWLERSERIPAEVVELTETWIGARRSGRETYRNSVERSFELAHSYVDSLAR